MRMLSTAIVCGFAVCGLAGAVDFDPANDLYPGMEFSLQVRFDEIPPSGLGVVSRAAGFPGGYLLRVDPEKEGRRLAFFVSPDGKMEPRVRSTDPVGTGVWYTVSAGWDGSKAYLSVDGVSRSVKRPGAGVARSAKLEVGGKGMEVRGFKLRPAPWVPSSDASMCKGFRMSCSVVFDEVPTGMNELVCKKGGYLLRYDRPGKGSGAFRFWPDVDGKWEPSVGIDVEVEPGKRYDVAVEWDGVYERIAVNGMLARRARSGKTRETADPPRIGRFPGSLTDLIIRPVRSPNAFFAGFRSRELMPRFGEKCTVLSELCNIGSPARGCRVLAESDPGVRIEPAVSEIGDLPDGAVLPLEWNVDPGSRNAFGVRLKLMRGAEKLTEGGGWLTAMPHEDPDMSAAAWMPPVKETRAFYVDSVHGDDSADGLSPESAWKTFANVKGLTLGPGERLLLKRGSVFNEELVVTAAGEPGNWAEIGAYGEGPRPCIRRDRDISARAAYILSPRYLVIRDLVVCNAGKGLSVDCVSKDSGHILVERCLAHHIEGLYRHNSHGIPEWFGRDGAPGGGRGGIAVSGAGAHDVVVRDSEMYQCSNGFSGMGRDVWFGRLFCHDNFCHNTSPHPVFTSTVRAWLVDSVFDSAGWNATWGTMGIMFANNRGLSVKGCHFVNMRDSGSGDGGGIDFECMGDNALVEECTFRNNAGAAVEFLGFSTPQAHNTRIRRCRFDRNNHSRKLGPSEIYVHGANDGDRRVTDSNGTVEDNGYVLCPGVAFFTNISEVTRSRWKLEGNRRYDTWEELAAAMPFGNPPQVDAGREIWTDTALSTLAAAVSADGGRELSVEWEQLEGPAAASLSSPRKARCGVALPVPGDYTFMVKADDGRYWRSSRTAVHRLRTGRRIARAWTFDRNLDSEGWSFSGLGTKREKFLDRNGKLSAYADPVNLVCGDYFVLAVKDARRPMIVSPDALGVPAAEGTALTLRMHNATGSRRMRVEYTTESSPEWSSGRSVAFDVRPHDRDDTVYEVKLPFAGRLKQLRIAFSDADVAVTGTCRIDYIHLSYAVSDGGGVQ